MDQKPENSEPAGENAAEKPANPASNDILREAGGSLSDNFNTVIINQTLATLWLQRANKDDFNRKVAAAMTAMAALAPRDELESMLGAQMIACHSASMECYRRAMLPDFGPAYRDANLEQAGKLTRCYVALLETLDQRRGHTAPKQIIVEHRVHHIEPAVRNTLGHGNANGNSNGNIKGRSALPGKPLLDYHATHMDIEHGSKAVKGFMDASSAPLPLPLQAD